MKANRSSVEVDGAACKLKWPGWRLMGLSGGRWNWAEMGSGLVPIINDVK